MATFQEHISKKKGRQVRAIIRRKGVPAQSKLFDTQDAAEKWARGIEHKIDKHEPLPTRILVERLIQEYRASREGGARPLKRNGNDDYMLRHLERDLGQHTVDELTPALLQRWCKKSKAEGAGGYTMNMKLSKLQTAFKIGSARQGIE
jgi:hypothetical protein